ncbi:MAG: MaoC/PaaZ C-terminal domain-containing protein [Bacillota bacterium]
MAEPALYFEDLEVGARFSSSARTVTEADIVNFAGVSGDYNALHVDAEYAKNSIFGERVAHGLLGLVIASGLFTGTDLNARCSKSLLALLGIDSWKFKGPLKIGDTVHLEIEVADKRETSRPDRGVVVFRRILVNQRGEVVQEGQWPMLILKKNS